MQEHQQRIEAEHVKLWIEHGIMNVIWKGATISLEMDKSAVEHCLLLSQKNVYIIYGYQKYYVYR
jgi:hypothetical protein